MNKYNVVLYYNGNRLNKIIKAKNKAEVETKIAHRYSIYRIVSIDEITKS